MRILFYLIKGYEKNINLHDVMHKTQKHINMKGIKLRNNIHRLYDII